MAEIIDMGDRRPLSPKVRGATRERRKILAVQKVFHCSRCRLKCEKCGTQIDVTADTCEQQLQFRVPYQFCGSCGEEYADYIERLKGRGDAECYWRNDDWVESWQRWIDYRGALDRFIRSKEFVKLLKELQETIP
jgi:hypothetical protein